VKTPDLPAEVMPTQGWAATLTAQFACEHGKTVMRSQHSGPLRLQKALYPESPRICHAVIVHPPGGIASGDDLQLDFSLERGAHTVVTTPGATKWYRKAHGGGTTQRTHLRVDADCTLEWVPQEAIAFEHCDAHAFTHITVATGGRCAGWDVWVLGRRAHGDAFDAGSVFNHLRIEIDGAPALVEHSRMHAATVRSVATLSDAHVCGLFWLAGVAVTEIELETLRAAHSALALTCPQENLLLARVIGHDPETLMTQLRALWLATRAQYLNANAVALRIWST
jgi:urease accessory protein